jgi:hypothetical protein
VSATRQQTASVRKRTQTAEQRSRSPHSALQVPSEHDEQVAIFQWVEWVKSEFPDLEYLHASLNGVRLPIGLAVKAKLGGMRAGVPDLLLPTVRYRPDGIGWYTGCFIELKRQRGGHLDPEQRRWRDYLQRQGYAWHEARGADAAKRVLLEYLGADAAVIDRLIGG